MEERSADPILQRRQHGQGATNAKRQMIKVASTFGNRQYTFCTASGKGADHAQGKIMGKMHRIGLASSLPPATQRHSSPEGAPMCVVTDQGTALVSQTPAPCSAEWRAAARQKKKKETENRKYKLTCTVSHGDCAAAWCKRRARFESHTAFIRIPSGFQFASDAEAAPQ